MSKYYLDNENFWGVLLVGAVLSIVVLYSCIQSNELERPKRAAEVSGF